ncbi:MAG: bifunctional metallophosphatase/5'-nucleotidase [Sphingobacteriales bacterium]
MTSRRSFIRSTAMAGASFLVSHPVLYAAEKPKSRKLTILHTNDVHSRLDPFADGSNAGKGGVAARAALVSKIRQEEAHVLLLDAGDMFQGTPYFNLYKGEPELKAMSMMKYDAGTIGNHDFDAGIENLATQLSRHASFPMINCNYDFSGTPMESLNRPWTIVKKGDLKIGLTGVGIEMEGLVGKGLFGTTKYNDPVLKANEISTMLKEKKGCDLVVCLSHLGDKYRDEKISDELLAQRSTHIDLIIGGHTHQFFEKPRQYKNTAGELVLVNQVGWGGLQLGRIDFDFTKGRGRMSGDAAPLAIEKY